jgi:hypothetical protein
MTDESFSNTAHSDFHQYKLELQKGTVDLQ